MAIIERLREVHGTLTPLSTSFTIFAFASFVIYLVVLTIWRLYLSPLAKIPGPKLAALTQWYETYFEIFKDGGGQFLFEYRKWHEQYGKAIAPILHLRSLNCFCQVRSSASVLLRSIYRTGTL